MKKIKILLFILLFIFLFSLQAYGEDDFIKEQIDSLNFDEIISSLDEDAKDILSELELDSLDFNKMFRLQPGKLFKVLAEIVNGKLKSPLKSFAIIISVLIITASVESFVPETDKMKTVLNCVSVLISLLVISKPIFTVADLGLTAVKMSSKFMLLFIPAFVAVISVSGNPQLAFSYNTLLLAFGQIVTQISDSIIKPAIGIFFSLGLSSSVSPEFNFREICSQIKKISTLVLSFLSGMFFSLLSIKGVLANAADSIASRGVKFLISSFIPIVGGSVSEGLGSIVGSVNMLKSVLGVFALSAVAIINLPVIIELTIWTVLLRLSAAVAETVSCTSISDTLKIIADATVFINVIIILNCVIIIISTALMLLIKAGT